MIISSYDTFVQYFRDMASSHIGINDFVVGNSERILNRQRNVIEYPILWLEVPDVSIHENGGYNALYSSRVLVLKNSPADDWEAEDASLNICLKIMFEVLTKMGEDAENGDFEFSIEKTRIYPKSKFSPDDDHGWLAEIQLIGEINQCVNPANFQ